MSRDSFFVSGAECSRGRVCLRGFEQSPLPSLPAGRAVFSWPSLPAGRDVFPRPSLLAGRAVFPRPRLPAGRDCFLRPRVPAGRDFGPGRTCGAFPPTAARRAPPRSRSPGRLRRPKSLPIRHSPAAAQCSSPWAAGMSPGMSHADASIRKSGLEIGNRCTDIPEMCSIAAAIAKSRPEIRNRCTEVPGTNLVAAPIAKSGPEIENHCSASCRQVEGPACGRSLPPRCRVRF